MISWQVITMVTSPTHLLIFSTQLMVFLIIDHIFLLPFQQICLVISTQLHLIY